MTNPAGTHPAGANPSGIGASIRRREDQRFLTGRGTYTDDINRPHQVHAFILRSPYAHARIGGFDLTAARAAPGVVAIFTGADLVADKVGSLPCGWQIHSKDGSPMIEPPHPPLVTDRVRHVGDQVALVLAETKAQARDAAELIVVDYQELPAVTGTRDALAPGAPLVHDQAASNLCFDWHLGDPAAVDAAFARAHHVTRIDLINNRLIANAMEPRAAIGEYDRATDDYTLWTTSQNPHVIRLLMGGFVLGIPEHKLRVIAPDVGGGFGSKIFHYAEEALVTWAARKIHRPVKWTADRSESFMSDAHGRDHVTHAELALDANGKFLGLRVNTIANMGAYLSTFAPSVPTYLYATLLAGQYATPAIYAEVRAVFTHTVPVDAYRGAGRPEACYVIERLVENAARELGIDRAELRRRNFIPPSAMPYATPVALEYDCGLFHRDLDEALTLIDYAGFPARKADSARRGKLRGIGFANYIEACGIAPSNIAGALGARAGLYESAEVRFHPTGSVTVFTGSHSHGQGHETTFSQLVSDRFGIPIDKIEIVHGDTSKVPFGMGTYGSRSLAVGGSAIAKAMDKIVAKGRKIAAHMLEAAETDIEFNAGRFSVAGTDRALGIADIALSAYVPHNYPLDELEPGLDEQSFYDPKNFTFPNGCQICELEIDPDTGVTKILAFVAADDFGKVINPMIVEGQVHGGIAQGIGQALMENCVYDSQSGQLLTGSYMDYCMPRADDLPSFQVAYHEEAPCTHNPLGVKGCGEAGTIGGSAAVMNAVVDALADRGITHLDMPATPERVWRALRDAMPAQAAE
ncbi:MAG: xanthine dehydrogenase family protein molybdopterin-binding subunit [Azospirillaceae bacterium]|nr:xanthine dehydrogenase family protein molybdopterin-binding subunit [Azospirillaceae bacterium]